MSFQVCHCCGWSKVTSYRGLRIHQGRMGCTPKGMRVMEHQQPYLFEALESPDLSLRVCHCGWTKRTTHRGLRIHQGRMGCTLKGARIPEKEKYDSNYNVEEEEHQWKPPPEIFPKELRSSSRKSSATAKIKDSSAEPPYSSQRANPVWYQETLIHFSKSTSHFQKLSEFSILSCGPQTPAAERYQSNGVSEGMQINHRIKREPESPPAAPVWRTAEKAPELRRQDFCSDLKVQSPFRDPLANPGSQFQERHRSPQVDMPVGSPAHVVQTKKKHRSVIQPSTKNPTVIRPKNKNPPGFQPKNRNPPPVPPQNRDPPVVLAKNINPNVALLKRRDSPVVPSLNKDAPVVPPRNREPPVIPPKNKDAPVILSINKDPPASPAKNKDAPVVPPKNKDAPVAPPKSKDPPVVPPKNKDAPVVPPKNKDAPVAPPKSKDAPVAPPKSKDPPVAPPKSKDPPVVPLKNKDAPVVPPKNKDAPVVPPKNKDAPVAPPKSKDPPVAPPKSKDPPVVPPKNKDAPVAPPKCKDPPVAPPKSKDPPVVPPKNKDPLLSKNREQPAVLSENKDSLVVLPNNKDPPVQRGKCPHPVLVELQNVLQRKQLLKEEKEKDGAAAALSVSGKSVFMGNESASRGYLRKQLSAEQRNRSAHPVIQAEIESPSFTTKLEDVGRILAGAGAQPTVRKKQKEVQDQVNTSKPLVPPKPKVLCCLVTAQAVEKTAVLFQMEESGDQSVTDITGATTASSSLVQHSASFSEAVQVDLSAAMKVKDLAQMFSGTSAKKSSNTMRKPKEEHQLSQSVKKTTSTEVSSQAEVSQEVPLTSELPTLITGMKVKELLKMFKSLESKTIKKEQQLFEVRTHKVFSYATKEATMQVKKTTKEEQKEAKTFEDVVTAVSKATEEKKPTKSLKVKELVQRFSSLSVPPKAEAGRKQETSSTHDNLP